jgi:DNA-binding response OmpR family regulator
MTKILICETENWLLNVLEWRLRKFRIEIVRAKTGDEALRKIHAGLVDAAVISVSLPDFRIDSFIGILRENMGSHIPLVILADGNTDEEMIKEALEAGADDFLMSPFRPSELVLRVEKARLNSYKL